MDIITYYKDVKSTQKGLHIHKPNELKHLKHPIALTIGNFDGMHLGHQKIFHTLKTLTEKKKGSKIVLTFSNHPVEILKPTIKIQKITPLEEKLQLLKNAGIDLTILLKFDSELQNMSYEDFIQDIREHISFDYLVLGEGASFGKNQEGNEKMIKSLEKKFGFETVYLDKMFYKETPISSQLIRDKLKAGAVEEMKDLLGRPYSIYAPFHLEKLQEVGENKLKITFDFQNHCLIPSGYYVVNLQVAEHECVAMAYLTTLGSEELGKTFDLEIFLKGPKSPFMNDQIKIEFLRKTSPTQFTSDFEGVSCKIHPFRPSKSA